MNRPNGPGDQDDEDGLLPALPCDLSVRDVCRFIVQETDIRLVKALFLFVVKEWVRKELNRKR